MDKNTQKILSLIIVGIIAIVIIYIVKKSNCSKNKIVESFNAPESSNNISLDDIQSKLDELQGGN